MCARTRVPSGAVTSTTSHRDCCAVSTSSPDATLRKGNDPGAPPKTESPFSSAEAPGRTTGRSGSSTGELRGRIRRCPRGGGGGEVVLWGVGVGGELFGGVDAASGARTTRKSERLRGLELFGRVGDVGGADHANHDGRAWTMDLSSAAPRIGAASPPSTPPACGAGTPDRRSERAHPRTRQECQERWRAALAGRRPRLLIVAGNRPNEAR